nr:type III-A CRISPR-associated RAMP protein Csm5 [Bacteroidota bacterium]
MNNLKIKVLSPLHIGDNENKKLSSLGDFIIENNYIRMINKKKLEQLFSIDEKIMEDYINQINFHSGKTYSLKPFLKDYEISIDEICSNEKIPIIGEFSGKEIHPFISENGKRYIPGSSVKGAI